MAIRLLSTVLVRAPLLRISDLRRARAALLRHPLGAAAVALASRDLGEALRTGKGDGDDKASALDRYARRAAFRPTPVGLLAGVTSASLGSKTRVHTSDAVAAVAPSWGRLFALGRALLDDPDVRAGVNLRLCPSCLRGPDEVCWLALGDDDVTLASALIDQPLARLLDLLGGEAEDQADDQAEDQADDQIGQSAGVAPWPAVRDDLASVFNDEGHDVDADTVDDWLLLLIDQGLLVTDLVPPLVGPPPPQHFEQRLRALAADERVGDAAAGLAAVHGELVLAMAAGIAGDVATARARLAALPGATTTLPDLHGVLRLETARPAAIDRRAIERAAALAPLLFGLQSALAAPVAERLLDEGLRARLADTAELFGAGAFDFAALATGGYGARLVEGDEPEAPARLADASADLYVYLLEGLTEGAEARRDELVLDAEVLAALLPETATPPSFELILSPARAPSRSTPGTDWLLGHHAPAGASWGRLAHELPEVATALAELAAIEAGRGDGRQILDVEHAASRGLADLSAHPSMRGAALALTGWPAAAAVVPADLELVIDDAAPEPLDLRTSAGAPIAPAPLHRVRSTTLPAGLHRLLAGWSFARQHTPWSFSWGPLATFPHLPRVVLAGFVIAPRSFRLPPREVLLDARAFAGWRRALRRRGFDRLVQVGQGDELLPVDLDAASAPAELARYAGGRGFEIWPPLDRLVDEGGRRIEVVAAAVDDAGPSAALTAAAGRVPPPFAAGPAEEWLTFRLYGAREQQSAVLFEVVAPLIAAARAEGDLDGWFFLPYVDPGTGRDHLRVRLAAADAKRRERLRRSLTRAAREAQTFGQLVAVESADYFPETARYGGPQARAAAEAIFEGSSDAVLAVLMVEHETGIAGDRIAELIRANDALARGLGLDLVVRRALAERRRRAFAEAAGEDDQVMRAEYRARQRDLLTVLAGDAHAAMPVRGRRSGKAASSKAASSKAGSSPILDPLAAAFTALAAATGQAAKVLSGADRGALVRAVPALLHVQAVRFCGADAAAEQLAYVLWARALDSLAARARAELS